MAPTPVSEGKSIVSFRKGFVAPMPPCKYPFKADTSKPLDTATCDHCGQAIISPHTKQKSVQACILLNPLAREIIRIVCSPCMGNYMKAWVEGGRPDSGYKRGWGKVFN